MIQINYNLLILSNNIFLSSIIDIRQHFHKLPVLQVTLLAALKVLGVSAGLLLSRPRTRRDVTDNMVRRKTCEDIEYNFKISD
jgi:hypothetical protein